MCKIYSQNGTINPDTDAHLLHKYSKYNVELFYAHITTFLSFTTMSATASEKGKAPEQVHRLPTTYLPTLPPQAEPYEYHRNAHTPIIIDNGSTNLRWGFGSSSVPNENPKLFTGPNAVAKYKERKTNKPLLLFGEAIDSESGARGQAKTPWEGDVLLNFDALVSLDFFIHIGLLAAGYVLIDDSPRDIGKCTGLCFHSAGHRYANCEPSHSYDGAVVQSASF